MNSLEKVNHALDSVEQLAEDPNVSMSVMAAASLLTVGRGHVAGMLPQTAEELDELLARGAEWMLGLQSDKAEPPAELESPQQVG